MKKIVILWDRPFIFEIMTDMEYAIKGQFIGCKDIEIVCLNVRDYFKNGVDLNSDVGDGDVVVKCVNNDVYWLISLDSYVYLKENALVPERVIFLQIDNADKILADKTLDCKVNGSSGVRSSISIIEYFQRCAVLLNYSKLYVDTYLRNKIKAHYFPLGYFPLMESTFLEDLTKVEVTQTRKYDVFFAYTTNSSRRSTIINLLGKKSLVCCGQFKNNLNQCLVKSKICLQIYNDVVTKPFDVARIFPLLSKKKFIVSEQSLDPELDAEFAPFMEIVPYDKIVETVLQYLKPEKTQERRTRAENGYAYLKEHYKLIVSLPKF